MNQRPRINGRWISLMEDIIQFCDKTINITTQEIIKTESTLETSTNNNRFQGIKSEIMKNEESSKNILRQCKFKKFNTLKYKLKVKKMMQHEIDQENYFTQI